MERPKETSHTGPNSMHPSSNCTVARDQCFDLNHQCEWRTEEYIKDAQERISMARNFKEQRELIKQTGVNEEKVCVDIFFFFFYSGMFSLFFKFLFCFSILFLPTD
jgi:hypothetical protein